MIYSFSKELVTVRYSSFKLVGSFLDNTWDDDVNTRTNFF